MLKELEAVELGHQLYLQTVWDLLKADYGQKIWIRPCISVLTKGLLVMLLLLSQVSSFPPLFCLESRWWQFLTFLCLWPEVSKEGKVGQSTKSALETALWG